jgi:hypothetical protein
LAQEMGKIMDADRFAAVASWRRVVPHAVNCVFDSTTLW